MLKKILIWLLLTAPALEAGAQKVWEELPSAIEVSERVDGETLDIRVSEGYVYVTTSEPVTVKIFSILGQLITQKDIPAGTWRTRISSRGIYILKVGSITRRITI